jgi:multidrug efflux pump subunit AcrA (membrane-fusion protein)
MRRQLQSQRLLCGFLGYLLVSTFFAARGQDAAVPAEPVQATKVATIHPELGPVQKSLSVGGQFVPESSKEIMLELKALASLEVVEAVKHGAMVRAGDVLVTFDAKQVAEQIGQQESALQSLMIAAEESNRESKLAEAKEAIEAEQAELTKRKADEDFKFFSETQFPFSEKEIEMTLKSMQDYTDYAAEEVKQLEKMYKADDLTEESEEIVLRRAKDDLERSKFSLEEAKLNFAKSKQFLLPRSKTDQIIGHRLAELAFEHYKALQPLIKAKREAAMKIQKIELEKAAKKLEELKLDLTRTKIVSPTDGVVYYGRVIDGKWSGGKEAVSKLAPHGSVMNHDVVMTIVQPDKIAVRVSIAEADIAGIAPGLRGHIAPTAFASERLDVVVRSIDGIPGEDGTYAMTLDLGAKSAKPIVAGMTGSVKLTTYFQPKAMTLPTKVIHKDELDEHKRYVWISGSNGQPERKEIVVGIEVGDKAEVLSGVAASDAVLLEKPASQGAK